MKKKKETLSVRNQILESENVLFRDQIEMLKKTLDLVNIEDRLSTLESKVNGIDSVISRIKSEALW